MNESDASVFAKRYGGSSQCWGVIWVILSFALAACGIIVSPPAQLNNSRRKELELKQDGFPGIKAGLAVFKDSFSEQAQRGKEFLPTRLLF